jgi:hypothetical protein
MTFEVMVAQAIEAAESASIMPKHADAARQRA